MIQHDRLKQLLAYSPDTGTFTWRVDGRGKVQRVGVRAGTISEKGYIIICADRKNYRAHRLAWFDVHGFWPPHEIDHINRDKTDNRINNLRLATHAENCQNMPLRRDNKHGVAGITFHGDKRKKRWQAKIKANGVTKYLGYYHTIEEAKAARIREELK